VDHRPRGGHRGYRQLPGVTGVSSECDLAALYPV